MSTAISSKNAANHVDSDKEETIDYNDMSKDVQERCALKNHPDKIIAMGDMKDYHNDLTTDQHDAQQHWRTVEYPAIGTGNTTKHDGQTYVIMNDGTLYGHLDHQSNKNKSAFLSGALDMTEWTPKAWFNYYMTMEKAGIINRVWMFQYYYRQQDLPNKRDFFCAN